MYAVAPIDTFITNVYPWALSEELKDNKAVARQLASYKNKVAEFTQHQKRHTVLECWHPHHVRYPNKGERMKGEKTVCEVSFYISLTLPC